MTLLAQLQELHLLLCSLLPGELLSFLLPPGATKEWTELLESHADFADTPLKLPSSPCSFEIIVDNARIWFQVDLPLTYPEHGSEPPVISVKGENIARREQEEWQRIVNTKMAELEGTDFPVFQLMSHLLPLLHADADTPQVAAATTSISDSAPTANPETHSGSAPSSSEYHALLTSHHLVSPTKRRALQRWAAELALAGFAKLGHPGVIYCAGAHACVEEFVARVRAMQWLALRLRFVEALDTDAPDVRSAPGEGQARARRWVELEKVGEVVEEMRKLGREAYVLEMGIGSVGAGALK